MNIKIYEIQWFNDDVNYFAAYDMKDVIKHCQKTYDKDFCRIKIFRELDYKFNILKSAQDKGNRLAHIEFEKGAAKYYLYHYTDNLNDVLELFPNDKITKIVVVKRNIVIIDEHQIEIKNS